MNIIFITGIYPEKIKSEIEKYSKSGIDYAANIFQAGLIKGLDNYYQVKLLNLPFVGSYPFLFKKPFISTFYFAHTAGEKDINIGFLNLPILKLFSRYFKVKKKLAKVLSKTNEETTIIIYSIHTPFLKSAVKIKKRFANIKICLIVPDLPEFKSDSKNLFYIAKMRLESIIINKSLKEVDSFVLLTDYMAEALDINLKPWVRIEGISIPSSTNNTVIKEKNKTIFYSGTLARRYGIMNMIEAFINIKSNDYRLWICGEGDCREVIERILASDKRIMYFGQLPHEEVLVLQKKATVLINPRTSEGLFTKYSFPSKIMEYFASGTPAIMHRLIGIPEEYFQFCYVVDEENAEGLKKTILFVCEKDQKELDEFGRKASDFILENKNPISQVKKLSNMLNSISNKVSD